MNYQILKHSEQIFQILLSPPIDGFENFICTWVYLGEETFIVDTGPSVTTDALLAALTEIGLTKPDYILLTHIHIDHAGGVSKVAAAFPDSPIICHDKARPHLVDPEKLWQGTVKTLGDTGRAYGKIEPVPEKRLFSAQKFSTPTIQTFLTPGHAPHHISFITRDGILFAGEAGGVNIDFHETDPYLRPATPPKFFMETSIASIDLLLDQEPRYICYGHTAMKNEPLVWLEKNKQQLLFWEELISEQAHSTTDDKLIEHCVDLLIKTDPLIKGLSHAPEPVLRREKYFIGNAIKGFIGYLNTSS